MNEEQHNEHHPDELEQLKTFARTYGRTVTIVLVILLVAVAGIRLHRIRKQSAIRKASALFATARSVQDLEALVNEYTSVPSAPLAKLRLAKSYYDAANYDLAEKTYKEIKEDHSDHALAAAADLGIVHCLEEKGQIAEALRGFEEFLGQNPGHFLAAQAIFGRARCLDQMYRTSEARVVIEDYIAANPDSGWMGQAEEMLDLLNQRLESMPVE